jgi:EAL domain-containing protein (putative c-di-GMP-specific phosphodiesterase class I)
MPKRPVVDFACFQSSSEVQRSFWRKADRRQRTELMMAHRAAQLRSYNQTAAHECRDQGVRGQTVDITTIHVSPPKGSFGGAAMSGWCLEGAMSNSASILTRIADFPFLIGRDAACQLSIPSAETSRQHARIDQDIGGGLRLTDLNSGNGTFVNRAPLHGSVLLNEGDVLHFGVAEFRVVMVDERTFASLAPQPDTKTVIFGRAPVLSEHFVVEEPAFIEMLRNRSVGVALQPIVRISDGRLAAFEVLGRGSVAGLPESPMGLFQMAARLGREIELSECFRWAGLSMAASLAPASTYFVNVHPKEMFSEAFYLSMALLRAMVPTAGLVVEVHETAVTQIDAVRKMGDRLAGLQVQFAYDDFGAGQARLLELAEAPPHFVKFDMGLIRDIDHASSKKQQLVAQLVHIVHDVGATALAEGVETRAEAACCAQMNFDLIQGYWTGRPAMGEAARQYPPHYVATEMAALAAGLRAARTGDSG